MTSSKSKFILLQEDKSGSVTIGNDALRKIIGKGKNSLDNGNGKAHNVLYVDGIKHNLKCELDVLLDNVITFHSKGCQIKNENIGKVVEKVVRNLGNVYILNEENKKSCLGKLDES